MFGPNSITLSVPETAKYLDSIHRNTIGLEDWITRFDNAFETSKVNYPPYNLIKESDTRFRLELAVAGFSKEDVEVTTEYNKLTVEAKQEDSATDEYLHRGLAARAFNRSWTLSDDVEIDEVTFTNGLLTVRLNKIVPDHQKRKVYEITGS
jgi:molecular chaperone IbpA